MYCSDEQRICWCTVLAKVPNVYMVFVMGESGETRLCDWP